MGFTLMERAVLDGGFDCSNSNFELIRNPTSTARNSKCAQQIPQQQAQPTLNTAMDDQQVSPNHNAALDTSLLDLMDLH